MSALRKMWFGTKQFSRWIKVQSPGSAPALMGSSERLDFGNGGVALRESINGHMEYALTWNRVTAREAREITDFASGLFGDGPYYLSEPSSTGQNVLNKAWSAPGLTAKDGIPLAGDARPEIVQNLDQSQGYPFEMAKYLVGAADPVRKFYLPVPPGHVAWVGAHGDTASTLALVAQPTVRGISAGPSTSIPVAGVNTPVRFTHGFPASGEQSGIELSLGKPSGLPVENRRNRFPRPAPSTTTDFGPTNATMSIADGGIKMTSTLSASGLGVRLNWQLTGRRPSVSPGEDVTFSADSLSTSGRQASLSILFYDAGGSYIPGSIVTSDDFGGTGVFQRGSVSGVAPAGATTAAFYVGNGTGAINSGDSIVFRRFLFGASGSYFDGDTAPVGNLTYEWAGEAGNSESIEYATQTVGTITLAGIMVQVLPTGITPENGPFISGQGAGGLEFEGRVHPVPYSLAHDSWGLAVKLVETEDWK